MIRFMIPCLFGLEGLVGDELRKLKMQDVQVENGHVYCRGELSDLPRLNINLRCGERVLVHLGGFPAKDFDRLFEGTKALPWEDWIPKDGEFPVKGYALNSALHSVPDCQRIVKKAVATRLGSAYGLSTLPETGSKYQIQFSIMNDRAELYLDTSGAGLHKRGYREVGVTAPLRETLAAAMVTLSRYRGKDPFVDPFCGSGTIAIEAALAARGRAPGIQRSFAAEKWGWLEGEVWRQAREEALSREFKGDYHIFASDIDPKAVEMAKENAKRAGVDGLIEFSVADARRFNRVTENGTLCTNPPYGERMMEQKEAAILYKDFGRALALTKGWKTYVICSHPNFEGSFGKKASKVRRLYNGMIPCGLYMYY